MVDPHVHLRDWKQSGKETVLHGMGVAKKAGITRLFDMPNTDPPLTGREIILKRLSLGLDVARKLSMHYHVFAGLTGDPDQVRDMVSLHSELFPLVVGLKMFLSHSTGNMGIVDIEEQRKVIRCLSASNYRGVLAVHAEKESLNNPSLYDPKDFSSHSDARPPQSEIESVKDIISLVREEGFPGHLHICHISTEEAVNEVLKAKSEGLSISMGATPHHALLSRDDAKDRKRGLKMNPPLRSRKDQMFIYSAIKEGLIDNIESDHAPHRAEDKLMGASGIPCFSGMLLLLQRLKEDGVPDASLRKLFGLNTLRIFGLEEEEIKLPEFSQELFEEIENSYEIKPF